MVLSGCIKTLTNNKRRSGRYFVAKTNFSLTRAAHEEDAPYGDLLSHSTEQLQLVLRNDHLNKTGPDSKANYANSIL